MLQKNLVMKKNYEDLFKIAARVTLNAMESKKILENIDRQIILEIFQLCFLGIRHGHMFDELRKFLIKLYGKVDSIFILYDSFFKFITRYCSPRNLAYEQGKKVFQVIDQWKKLWDHKESQHNHLDDLEENLINQLNMLVYQIVSSYDTENHNLSTLQFIKSMVCVISSIILHKDNVKQSKLLLKRVRSGLNEILRKFCVAKVKKALYKEVDEINAVIID